MTRRIAAISDIHGVAAALAAVLRWFDGCRVSEAACAGDVAAFGPRPNECISMLVRRGIQTVLGNSDHRLIHPSPSCAPSSRRESEIIAVDAWVRGQLSEESRSYLRSLPSSLHLDGEILVVHGAPGDMSAIVGPGDNPPIPAGTRVVLAGHLHVPFVTESDCGLWVNVGSAGRPCDGDPRPAVTILTESRGRSRSGWNISQHRIGFDPRESAREILESGMPFAENVASAVLEARWYRSS